jgi:energy-converting hydrogenase Eha subunit B
MYVFRTVVGAALALLATVVVQQHLMMSAAAAGGTAIDMNRVLIATVLDLAEKEIIRDAFSLIRSIRRFGGSMNNATIVVWGAVRQNESCVGNI